MFQEESVSVTVKEAEISRKEGNVFFFFFLSRDSSIRILNDETMKGKKRRKRIKKKS